MSGKRKRPSYSRWSDDTPKAKKPKISIPIPLVNIGNNCYLNSALQGLSSCKKFVGDINELSKKWADFDKLQILNNLMQILNNNLQNEIEISKNKIFENWMKHGQQDSFELLAHIIQEVYGEIRQKKEIKNIQEWSIYELPMRIIMAYSIETSCGHSQQAPNQSNLALHLGLEKLSEESEVLDLQSLIDNHFKETKIYDYHCDECDKEVDAFQKKRVLKKLPSTLCIHLQRNKWNLQSKQMEKNSVKVKFDDKLTWNSNKYNGTKGENKKYELVSVLQHIGSYEFGHYVCYKRAVGEDGWYIANDRQISPVTLEKVLASEAYILFYEMLD